MARKSSKEGHEPARSNPRFLSEVPEEKSYVLFLRLWKKKKGGARLNAEDARQAVRAHFPQYDIVDLLFDEDADAENRELVEFFGDHYGSDEDGSSYVFPPNLQAIVLYAAGGGSVGAGIVDDEREAETIPWFGLDQLRDPPALRELK